MRAAEAARNTSNLIEVIVKRIQDGTHLVGRTSEAFSEVAKGVRKVGELVTEIAMASREQAQGIDQVNKAVNGMDQIAQQNAANAEESAGASEELNAQATYMKEMVASLARLVGEKRNRNFRKRLVPTDQIDPGSCRRPGLCSPTSAPNRRQTNPPSDAIGRDSSKKRVQSAFISSRFRLPRMTTPFDFISSSDFSDDSRATPLHRFLMRTTL